jgi:co-chaperonin GroES (HSP10)
MSKVGATALKQIAPEAVRNGSGLHPLGVAVLVEPYEPEVTGSIIELPPSVKERTTMIENRARVVEVGPLAWKEEGVARARPGDLVFIARFAGWMGMGPKDDKVYRIVNDKDIFCAVEEGV